MKQLLLLLIAAVLFTKGNAQFLKKLKDKAKQAVEKTIEKKTETKEKGTNGTVAKSDDDSATSTPAKGGALKVFSKFDFVPGATILYFDNFEKDNIGEAPEGWITSTSAEVVTIDGLEGKWLKLASNSASHVTRNKKQTWGDNFTVEFDLLMVKETYDPRIDILLINSGGSLVTDEAILKDGKPAISFGSILGDGGKTSRVMLNGKEGKKLSDNMSENLAYDNATPVHVSMCVQGKRFRMWWNNKKVFDLSAINETYLPNQLGFSFGNLGGTEYYVSNFRVAKDVPDTRKQFEDGKLISNLLFYTSTAKLKPESMGSLLDVSKVLKEATAPVKIIGHTDSDGDDAANQQLSQERAEAVKTILTAEYGIEADKLTTEGRGETQPLADNKNTEGKAQNRRVEFIFKAEADVYEMPAGIAATTPKPAANNNKAAATKTGGATVNTSSGAATVSAQSKLLTTSLPYAQIMKTSDNRYTFIASKEEGNSKENYIKIELETAGGPLKADTYNFSEINKQNPLYGTKKYPEIKKTEAVLYYGAAKKPYINTFSPIIANGTMASYVSEDLIRRLPAVSHNAKFVIEKLEGGKASGYFTAGIMVEGLKPITKGDAMQETFTTGFSGEIKFKFSNVPVY